MTYRSPTRPGALACALLLSACGSQISHDRVVAAAGLQGATLEGASSGTGPASGPGSGSGVTQLPSSPVGVGSGATSRAIGTAAPTRTTGPGGNASTGAVGTTGGPGTSGTGISGTPTTKGCGKGTGTIKLGNVGPYSATAAGSTASPARDILLVWQAEVNAKGGICGRKVEVLSRDDRGDTSQDASRVKDLVENEHVVAFVGNITALTLAGQQSYLEGKRVPVLGGDLITDAWFTSPVYFPQGVNQDEANYAHLKLVQGRPGGRKVAFLYCAEFAQCQHGYDAFITNKIPQKAGSEIVYSKKVSLTAISFASECQEAKKAGAGVLYAGGDASFVNRVANSCGQQGITFEYLVNGGSVGADQQDNQYLNNHMFVNTPVQPWPATNTPGSRLYSDSIARYGPNVPKTGNSMVAWTAAIMAEHILETIGDMPITSASILASARAMKSYDNMGLSGSQSFRNGSQKTSRCVGAVSLVNGAFTAVNGGTLTCRSGPPLGGVGSS